MKLLFFLLCCLFSGFIMAQDCRDHALMQKNTQLEYEIYWPKRGSLNSTGKPASHLLFEVEQVNDSAGSTRSSIIKSAIGVFSGKKHFQRKVTLQCDGQNLLIPMDLFLCDTLYTEDCYPKVSNSKYNYVLGFKPLADTIAYIVPLALDCILSLPEFKKQFVQEGWIGYREFSPCKRVDDLYIQNNIGSITLDGKEMVTTAAGTFACYKFVVSDVGFSPPATYCLYFNKEAGLVKYEDHGRTIELTSIRK